LAAKFDLVISDFQMPVVNGLEFVRLMRRTPSAADVPVLLLSSVDLGFAATTLQSLGVSTTLMKPAFGSTLIAGVCSALGRTVTQGDKPGLPTQESLRSEGTQAEAHRLKVLVVEDNRVNQKLIKQLLVNRGHDVVVAENGEEALTILEETGALGAIAHHGASPVDVVLMDIQMPIMDGIEATSIIRQKEEGLGSHLPIIALTANAFDNQRQQYLEAGMDDYLPKPIDTSQLTALLKLYGEKKSAGEKMTITPPAPLS
jgi:CheY-like chemotaxis protein